MPLAARLEQALVARVAGLRGRLLGEVRQQEESSFARMAKVKADAQADAQARSASCSMHFFALLCVSGDSWIVCM